MARDPLDKALAWDGIAALDRVWDELARRMGASDRPVRQVHIAGLDELGRRRLASLFGLGRIPNQERIRINVAKLAGALGLDEPDLWQLVERLRGPIANRAAAARASAEARAALWSRVEQRLADRIPQTLARIRSAGVPANDVAAHGRVLDRLADALDRLPAQPAVPLPMFAWQVCGDPHGLDVAAPCGRYLQLAAVEMAGAATDDPDAITVRRSFQDLGVITDRLSSTTITYGLRSRSDSPLGRLLEAACATKIPVNVSGAALDRGSPRFEQMRWLCVENPSVVESAVVAGTDIPLVCTSGWPSTDTQRLLELAREQGIELCYAGDYDGEGLAIAKWMSLRYGAAILMTAAAYDTADLRRAPMWTGIVPDTPWDLALGARIHTRRRIAYQEDPAILEPLLAAFP